MPDYSIHVDDPSPHLIQGTVSLHQGQIRAGFMTSLGPRFLTEVFRNIARSGHGVSLVATRDADNTVCGFLLGTTHMGGLYRDFIWRHGLKGALFAAPRILRPARIRKIFETLLYPARHSIRQPSVTLPSGELLDLAVDDSSKGTGLATMLFDAFVDQMKRKGHSRFRVTTGDALTRAHRFYESRGAKRVGEVSIHKGELTYIYVYEAGVQPAVKSHGGSQAERS